MHFITLFDCTFPSIFGILQKNEVRCHYPKSAQKLLRVTFLNYIKAKLKCIHRISSLKVTLKGANQKHGQARKIKQGCIATWKILSQRAANLKITRKIKDFEWISKFRRKQIPKVIVNIWIFKVETLNSKWNNYDSFQLILFAKETLQIIQKYIHHFYFYLVHMTFVFHVSDFMSKRKH